MKTLHVCILNLLLGFSTLPSLLAIPLAKVDTDNFNNFSRDQCEIIWSQGLDHLTVSHHLT